MSQTAQVKQRTNVTIDSEILSAARDLRLNVSAISEAALSDAVRLARAQSWQAENEAALAERRRWIEREGLPLADLQILVTD
ncbi:type II toxin-antitoxin system CcdA family antitoxin [Sulfitobacter aestuarii]|uniref:Type II toxin-antitoxin system CcdA family antitoxin n=1 Tax=Sulfitobacter aestuarii TaxID=2161676 RepID=A0ABW5U5A7_9RHOB